jgi:transposase
MFYRLFTVCSARVSELMIGLSDSQCERLGKWKTCPILKRGQIVGARLAGASVIKSATFLAVSGATVSKVISAYTNHGKTTSAKRNSGRKSTLTERDRRTLRIVSKNHRITAAQVTTELNIHLVDPVSTKTVRRELHISNIHSRAAIAKPLITESKAQMRK